MFFKSVPKYFDHKCNKGFHIHFYTTKSLDCVGSYLEPKDCGTDFMSGEEQAQFLDWF